MTVLAAYPLWLLPANIVAWGLAHSLTGYAAHRLPEEWCRRDNVLTRIRKPERTERRYRRFGVRRWKDALPEAGAVFNGGVSKRHLVGTNTQGLIQFAAMTRRAEMAHWMAALVSPLFALWNPEWIAGVMVVYGVGVNAPFIAIQRYNRARLLRLVARRESRADPSATD